jgi:hypothetical protein
MREMTLTADDKYNLQIASELSWLANMLTSATRIHQVNDLVDRLESGAFRYNTTTTDYQRRVYFKAVVRVLMRKL